MSNDAISRAGLEKELQWRYMDYRGRSQTSLPNGLVAVDSTLETAAVVMKSALDVVMDAPTIEPQVVHARWVRKAGKSSCSHCGAFAKWDSTGGWWEMAETPHCPGCGCRMDAEEENHG